MMLADLQRQMTADLLAEGAAPSSPGFEIYRNAYRARLVSALRSGFDRTWSWIGDEAFDAAAAHHIILHPPSSWTLDDYGADFPHTLDTLFPDDPEVGELAWLEWQMMQAFASADGPVLDAAGLAKIVGTADDIAAARFECVPGTALRKITSQCAAIWTALAEDRDPAGIDLVLQPAAMLVWRKGLSPHFRVVADDEQVALAAVLAGHDFGRICEAMAGTMGNELATQAIGIMLGRWVEDGLIAAVHL